MLMVKVVVGKEVQTALANRILKYNKTLYAYVANTDQHFYKIYMGKDSKRNLASHMEEIEKTALTVNSLDAYRQLYEEAKK